MLASDQGRSSRLLRPANIDNSNGLSKWIFDGKSRLFYYFITKENSTQTQIYFFLLEKKNFNPFFKTETEPLISLKKYPVYKHKGINPLLIYPWGKINPVIFHQ